MRPVWVCGGVISLDLPLHQPPTSESCLPVALDCRGEGRHRRNQNTQMFSQLVERTFEWKNNEIEENAELDCLRDYQGLIKAQDGFIEPRIPIWLSLSISFPFWLWPILYSETFAFLDIIILPVTATNFQIVKVFPQDSDQSIQKLSFLLISIFVTDCKVSSANVEVVEWIDYTVDSDFCNNFHQDQIGFIWNWQFCHWHQLQQKEGLRKTN